MQRIWKRLIEKTKVVFKDIFKESKSRPEAVASFLAVLELVKLKKIRIEGSGEESTVYVTDDRETFNLEGIED